MTLRPTTVFIVDDDASARRGLARLVRAAGYNVEPYADASDLLAAVADTHNACLVLDARMPGMDGAELMAELTSRSISMPTIVVTADEDPRTRRGAREMGAVAFFRKPVDGPALLDAIAWALGNVADARRCGEQNPIGGTQKADQLGRPEVT